ncbi:nucleoside kinase [Candidatus Fermentibacteria bacterium]|nr:MAG: nucleoside kinase [Candidatus Fermentibacteria bacterium]
MTENPLKNRPSIALRHESGIVLPLGSGRGEPVPPWISEGREVYRRGLILALDMAAKRVYPKCKLWVEHSISLGYRCRIEGMDRGKEAEVCSRLDEELKNIVSEALPVEYRILSSEEALDLTGEHSLLPRWHEGKESYRANVLGDSWAFAMGPAVPDTSWLTAWELKPMEGAFLLRFPGSGKWPEISQWRPSPKLSRELDLEEKHIERMRVHTVDLLNRRIREDSGREVVMMSHFYQNRRIVQIVSMLGDAFPEKRIIMIAGPSCSGKTTFTRMLSTYLRAQGFRARMISVDNYFRDRSETPRNKDGSYDFECLEALNTDLFGEHVKRLVNGETVKLPVFDFHTGTREDNVTPMKLGDNEFLLIEGIHGLNDSLTPGVDIESKFKIYISALTTLNVDRLTRMSTSDGRLIRRIVRDSFRRGYSAQQTIEGWSSVRAGERKNIFPFQEQADVMFNSALPYELPVMRPYVMPLLEEVEEGTAAYHDADRLMRLLDCVEPISESVVPRLSIIREFIDGLLLDWSEK